MENATSLWLIVKSRLKELYDDNVYHETFDSIPDVYKTNNGYIYLIIDNMLNKYKIEKFYLEKMNKILNENTSEKMAFKLILQDDVRREEEQKKVNVLTTVDNSNLETVRKRKLRPEYTFTNFVTGEANREAFTSALKVAESPYVTSNPLYIFGDVGLGKTHLMMAIGHYILDNNINANVVYTTAQQFVEDFYNSKSKNQKSTLAAQEFNNYYRSADLLLVDDIQFLSGKTGSQEEFFKLFEDLFENNKQIVITSDRPANELDIMARLKSRFAWGLPVDVKKPNFDLRKAIIKKKLAFLINTPEDVNDDVLSYIANNFTENIRELEGALRRFINYCVSFNYDFTLENAIASLSSLNKEKATDNSGNSIQVDRIKNVIATYFNINIKDLTSSSRKQELVYARDILIYILREKYNYPLKKIGEFLGGKDHSTIAHSLDKMQNGVSTNSNIKQDINNIISKIEKIDENY